MLTETNYDQEQARYLVNGFRFGFNLGYAGRRTKIRRLAPNLRLNVGSPTQLWNKVMKEVKLKRYAGPYLEVPYQNFIQSPIGLVPKDHGKDTRLIFHLSYPKDGDSVNSCTPKHLCKVKYPEFEDAIERCCEEEEIIRQLQGWNKYYGNEKIQIHSAKSDVKSAFHLVPLRILDFHLLIMKAINPVDGKTYFFVDKCLPFGASQSCQIFQDFSNSLAHIQRVKSGKVPINYLDDYYFVAWLRSLCDQQIQTFLDICHQISVPISLEKTVWSTTSIVFLGLLIDSVKRIVAIPIEKVICATNMIEHLLNHKKMTVHQLQKLCGFLNFLCRAIAPGRAFMRRMYAVLEGKNHLKPHHHIQITSEMKMDMKLWAVFLSEQERFARHFIEYSKIITSKQLMFY